MNKPLKLATVLCLALMAAIASSCQHDDPEMPDNPDERKITVSFDTGALYREPIWAP